MVFVAVVRTVDGLVTLWLGDGGFAVVGSVVTGSGDGGSDSEGVGETHSVGQSVGHSVGHSVGQVEGSPLGSGDGQTAVGVGVGVGAVVDIGIGVFLYQQPQEVPGPIDERNRQIGRRFKIVSDLEEPGEPLLAGAV